jgi:mono/diheme cytochrome c family protein
MSSTVPSGHHQKYRKGFWTLAIAAAGVGAAFAGLRFSARAAAEPGGVVEKVPAAPPDAHVAAKTPVEAGRYIVMTAGCNDCHTPGYSFSNGQVAELDWLAGNPVGWYGPWGTTYASNLRLMVADMTEDAWVKMLHERHERPPMPWTAVNAMSEQDTRAIYQYIKSLGKHGQKMPEPLPAGTEPKTAYLSLIPQKPAAK